MRKMTERLLIFFIGLPLILTLIIFLPHLNHVGFNIALVIFSALGAVESAELFKHKNDDIKKIKKSEAALLGLSIPLGQTLVSSFNVDSFLIPCILFLALTWILIRPIFSPLSHLDSIVGRFGTGCALVLYPGCLTMWMIKITDQQHATELLLVFVLCVIANDSLAWVFGTLFGKNNRGIIPISPNKSVAGFCGGFIASVAVGLGAMSLFRNVFIPRSIPLTVAGILLGAITGCAAILGDLAESALKRSAHIKDSGKLIPGRGGILDSIDSLALAAPFYYILCRSLFVL
ncbi:putative phosphatidate cytidylyltransferase [Pillotina sp. SPG140]|jgi:phosphatidate cytidylyltransferase